jgi:hypothetical protein
MSDKAFKFPQVSPKFRSSFATEASPLRQRYYVASNYPKALQYVGTDHIILLPLATKLLQYSRLLLLPSSLRKLSTSSNSPAHSHTTSSVPETNYGGTLRSFSMNRPLIVNVTHCVNTMWHQLSKDAYGETCCVTPHCNSFHVVPANCHPINRKIYPFLASKCVP